MGFARCGEYGAQYGCTLEDDICWEVALCLRLGLKHGAKYILYLVYIIVKETEYVQLVIHS